ncbi:MAG: hypothetical protein U0703_12335 [Anaerolineae bacterium]
MTLVLRFADGAGGYPRRANSIQLLYLDAAADEKTTSPGAAFRARGSRTVFK